MEALSNSGLCRKNLLGYGRCTEKSGKEDDHKTSRVRFTPDQPKVSSRRRSQAANGLLPPSGLDSEANVFVLNGLRIEDPEQPEHDGSPGVCQIDHLVLHRWGGFIIESKSVTDEVAVRDDGAGGDEWTRKVRGRELGFPSPIQQARRQGDVLRAFLQRHRESLLGKMPTGLRSLSKFVAGTDQRGFGNTPIQLIVAISDNGKIRRVNRWKEPAVPFRTFVSKADLAPAKIREELDKHKAAGSLLGESKGGYGVWSMKAEEVPIVAEFLAARHTPKTQEKAAPSAVNPPMPSTRPAKPELVLDGSMSAAPACKGCGDTDLSAKWGKYGYYWKCLNCDTNTSMSTICSVCGVEGHRGKGVRIRKDGPKYFRSCEQCGIEERIWTESS